MQDLNKNTLAAKSNKVAAIEMATKRDDLINALFALTEHRRGKELQA